MITSRSQIFAIEWDITEAYERVSLRALGFFSIRVGSAIFGRQRGDASLLACSFDAVVKRIASRGSHCAPFSEFGTREIAAAYYDAIYGQMPAESYFGMSRDQFTTMLQVGDNALQWAPDGDEAFDDGSHVLQFDIGDRVRLIGFRILPNRFEIDLLSLTDLQITGQEYYGVLSDWREEFLTEWNHRLRSSVPKRM